MKILIQKMTSEQNFQIIHFKNKKNDFQIL